MRLAPSLLAALVAVAVPALVVAVPALAQQAAPPAEQPPAAQSNPQQPATDQKKPELANDPNVQASQHPEPTPQGTRPPKEMQHETAAPDLQQALAEYRKAPPDLQGNPMPRPNDMAAEPGPDAVTR